MATGVSYVVRSESLCPTKPCPTNLVLQKRVLGIWLMWENCSENQALVVIIRLAPQHWQPHTCEPSPAGPLGAAHTRNPSYLTQKEHTLVRISTLHPLAHSTLSLPHCIALLSPSSLRAHLPQKQFGRTPTHLFRQRTTSWENLSGGNYFLEGGEKS
jgi:hypothetical protein